MALKATFSSDSMFYANLSDEFYVRVITEDEQKFDSQKYKFRVLRATL